MAAKTQKVEKVQAADAGSAMLSVYLSGKKNGAQVVDRLQAVANAKDRSTNYVAVEAILQYLETAEK